MEGSTVPAPADLIANVLPTAVPAGAAAGTVHTAADGSQATEPSTFEALAKKLAAKDTVSADSKASALEKKAETSTPAEGQGAAGNVVANQTAALPQGEAIVSLIAAGLSVSPETLKVAEPVDGASAAGATTPTAPAIGATTPSSTADAALTATGVDPTANQAPGSAQTAATPGATPVAASPSPLNTATAMATLQEAGGPTTPASADGPLGPPAAKAEAGAALLEEAIAENVVLPTPESRAVRETPLAVADDWSRTLPDAAGPAKQPAAPTPIVSAEHAKPAPAAQNKTGENKTNEASSAPSTQPPPSATAPRTAEALPGLTSDGASTPAFRLDPTLAPPGTLASHDHGLLRPGAGLPVVVVKAHATGLPNALLAEPIAVSILRQMRQGSSQFEIRLDPPELGRIDVRLDVTHEGRASATLLADRPETLDLLARDARALQRALSDAGLQLDSNALNFGLRDGSSRQGRDDGGDGASGRRAAGTIENDENNGGPTEAYLGAIEPGRLDLRV